MILVLVWGCTRPHSRSRSNHDAPPRLLTVCELFHDLTAFEGKTVAVRGIYFFGLRENGCSGRFVAGGREWPTAIDLSDSSTAAAGGRPVSFVTDQASWDKLDQLTIREGLARRHEEIWVTVLGQIRGPRRRDRFGRQWGWGGYGHLGSFPAELVVKRVYDIEIRQEPTFDYSEMLPPRPGKRPGESSRTK